MDSFGKVISTQEQNERIHGLSYIPFKVRLIKICFMAVIGYLILIVVVKLYEIELSTSSKYCTQLTVSSNVVKLVKK